MGLLYDAVACASRLATARPISASQYVCSTHWWRSIFASGRPMGRPALPQPSMFKDTCRTPTSQTQCSHRVSHPTTEPPPAAAGHGVSCDMYAPKRTPTCEHTISRFGTRAGSIYGVYLLSTALGRAVPMAVPTARHGHTPTATHDTTHDDNSTGQRPARPATRTTYSVLSV